MPPNPKQTSELGKKLVALAKKVAPYAATIGAGTVGGVGGYHLGKAVERRNDTNEDRQIAEQFYNLGERDAFMKTSELINTIYEQAFTDEMEKVGAGKSAKGILSFARPILEKLRIMKPKQTHFERIKGKTKEVAEKAWGATRGGAEKAWGATKGGAEKAWGATRGGAEEAFNATKGFGVDVGKEYAAAGKAIATTPTKSFGLAGQHLLNIIRTNPKASAITGGAAVAAGTTGVALGMRKKS